MQLSASLRVRPSTRSTISLPMVYSSGRGRASSLPEMICSGWYRAGGRCRCGPRRGWSLEVNHDAARGTCLLVPVSSEKKVPNKASSPPPMVRALSTTSGSRTSEPFMSHTDTALVTMMSTGLLSY
jgi:hypothetical protein